jgi:hypothetical protein
MYAGMLVLLILLRYFVTYAHTFNMLRELSMKSEISSSHGGKYENGCLPGCCAV